MTEYLDLENWSRKKQFDFFLDFDNPFFNISTQVEVTRLVSYARSRNYSLAVCLFYLALKVANSTDEFRYRLEGDRVAIHPVIHAGCTVLNKDDSFGFARLDYTEEFSSFRDQANSILATQDTSATNFSPDGRTDLIHFSLLPYLEFTSVSHPRNFDGRDSVPKMVLGKYSPRGEKLMMPFSVEVHHSLMDGIHVARFFQRFEKVAGRPGEELE